MKELSLEKMEEIKGGCKWSTYATMGGATVALFLTPWTGGMSMGLFTLGMFVLSAYDSGHCF